jgi:3-dehydroquinate dehydratase II
MKILLLHGPNLNMLGQREPGVYGTMTLEQINAQVMERAAAAGAQVVCFQSNHEGALIDMLQAEAAAAAGVIINPGALTHYGLSLRDALAALRIPIVEVHISNVYRREPFRHTSVVAPVATGQIAGLGWYGYVLALEWLLQQTKKE